MFVEKANPKLASLKDDDERLPIHWAAAYNRLPIVELLVANKHFDPDVTVSLVFPFLVDYSDGFILQDGSGWTPLMIAASLKNAEGDPIVDLLLRKEAEVNIKSVSGQVSFIKNHVHLGRSETVI